MDDAILKLQQAIEACELGALTLPDQIDALLEAGHEVIAQYYIHYP